MEWDFLAALLLSAELIAVIDDRAAWGLRPQTDAMPAIGLSRATGGLSRTFDGPDNTIQPEIQVDCWAASYVAAKDLSTLARGVIEGITGPGFQGCEVFDAIDDFEAGDAPGADGADAFYRVILRVRATYDES